MGCFGSHARDDLGVGSDLDVVLRVRQAAKPFVRRAVRWDLSVPPVLCDAPAHTPE